MIFMTRTPLRVSLFGGGTDYPEYFERKPGAVVGLTIDKYIYIAALKLNAHQSYGFRVSYSLLEMVNSVDHIQHPVVREALRLFSFEERLDINVMSDLPATGSGLGSSSAFTVGFVNLVSALSGRALAKIDLARKAIMIERDILKENVGVQDQLHAAFGGLNRFDFEGSRIAITPLQVTGDTMRTLSQHLVLVHTGVGRRATSIVADQISLTKSAALDRDLSELFKLVGECSSVLETGGPDFLAELGRMMSESWLIKRGLTGSITNDHIDNLYNRIIGAGAYGAKLCGAGGGGFFLALMPPDGLNKLASAVEPQMVVPIEIDSLGSSLVYPSNAPVGW